VNESVIYTLIAKSMKLSDYKRSQIIGPHPEVNEKVAASASQSQKKRIRNNTLSRINRRK